MRMHMRMHMHIHMHEHMHMVWRSTRVACSWRSTDARMPDAGADSAASESAYICVLATAVGEWLSEERRLTLTWLGVGVGSGSGSGLGLG